MTLTLREEQALSSCLPTMPSSLPLRSSRAGDQGLTSLTWSSISWRLPTTLLQSTHQLHRHACSISTAPDGSSLPLAPPAPSSPFLLTAHIYQRQCGVFCRKGMDVRVGKVGVQVTARPRGVCAGSLSEPVSSGDDLHWEGFREREGKVPGSDLAAPASPKGSCSEGSSEPLQLSRLNPTPHQGGSSAPMQTLPLRTWSATS